jgi:methylenetetrahydrofolate dehydrogenase (NADP+)/methenyltetrahydrofolate cyclohydrolase
MIDCKKYADEILNSITGYGHLAVISVGEDPASASYIKGKRKDCERVGFGFTHYPYPEGVEQNEIIYTICMLNDNPDITGIIVQLPLPAGYDADKITRCIVPEKDVDGFRADSPYKPCTPEGIVYLLKRELGDLTGKHAVVIGRGKLVGKPLAKMLLDEDMTVTICHSKSHIADINYATKWADAIIVATGQPQRFILHDTRADAVVIDCGVHRGPDGRLCGDVLFANSKRITPVPGGVGLLTRAMLMRHVERRPDNG